MATYAQSEYGDAQYGTGADVIDQGEGNSGLLPCGPWIDTEDLCCEGDESRVDCEGVETPLVFPWSDAEFITAATNILYKLTCERFSGVCEYVVRPCVGCIVSPCHWWRRYEGIILPTKDRVLGVSSVEIDGVVLDPALYRLIDRDKLIRTDCERWPLCQRIGGCSDCCEDIVVTYTAGVDPPIELKIAVADLACELKKACNGDQSCKLDKRVTGITRRGVEMEFDEVGRVISEGRTGIASIDHALDVWGDCPDPSGFFDPLEMGRVI